MNEKNGWYRQLPGQQPRPCARFHLFEDLEEVNRLSEQLNSTTFNKVQEVLELIHNSANKLMDTNNMYIALYDDYSDVVRFGLMYELGKKVDVETDPRYQLAGKRDKV